MKLSKYTFGNTPAAIYLADRLNQIESPKWTRKISSKIHSFQTTIAQLTKANSHGIIDARTLSFTVEALHQRVYEVGDRLMRGFLEKSPVGEELPDVLSIDLMMNVVMGDLKHLKRGIHDIKLLKQNAIRVTQPPQKVPNFTISDVSDPIDADLLVERSKQRLSRRKKQNTFY